MVGTRLVLFFGDRSGGGLGTYNGEHIVYVDNPTATTPDQWVKQSAFPRSTTTDFGFVVEQSAALLDGAYLLVYYQGGGGTGCAAAVGTRLARFAVADIAAGDFSKREWWDGTAFLAQSSFGGCDAAPPVVANLGMANGGGGGAVLKDAAGRYVEFAGGAFFGGGFTQAAASPAGPWPGGVNRMVAPENTRENVTTYIWNPHAGLTGAGAGRTWVTWCSNGSTVFSDESVYYPRFAKLADPA
jgi:hypothetical protein